MAWVLTRGLTTWRNEINDAFPGRDKASDGSVGDLRHQTGTSGHNPDKTGRPEYRDNDALDEVRAIDVDGDLRNPKFSMEQLVQFVISLARAGKYVPFRYVIYKGRIWSRSDGWKTRTYTGSNKHDKHAHFSGDYTQKADGWTGSLGLKAYVAKVTAPKPPVKPPAPGKLPHYELGKRVLKQGVAPGDDVQYVQTVTGGTKHYGPLDGVADAAFKKGVQRYQRIVGLSADGIVGPNTWKMIKKI